MVNLSVEIDEDQSNAFEEVLYRNPGWSKALVVRSLLSYFLKLDPREQENLVKKYGVGKSARRRTRKI